MSLEEESYGTFIDINNMDELKKYADSYYNPDGPDENIPNNINPKKIATEWIIQQNQFKIISEIIIKEHTGYHDEIAGTEKIEVKENFYYDYDIKKFECEKDGKKFSLCPLHDTIRINNINYRIPKIKIYNCSAEKIGLKPYDERISIFARNV